MAVEQPAEPVDGAARVGPGNLLGDLRLAVPRVAEHVEIEPVQMAGGGEGSVRGLYSREDPTDGLVADRHGDGRSRAKGRADIEVATRPRGAPAPQHPESDHGRPEPEGDPRPKDREYGEGRDLDRGQLRAGKRPRQGPRG